MARKILKTGATRAVSSQVVSDLRPETELWKRFACPGDNSGGTGFRSLVGILSGPGALYGLRFDRSFWMPLTVICLGFRVDKRWKSRTLSHILFGENRAELVI